MTTIVERRRTIDLIAGALVLGDEMKPYAVGKGTIRFQADKPIPFELVTRIVEIRDREVGAEARQEATSNSPNQ